VIHVDIRRDGRLAVGLLGLGACFVALAPVLDLFRLAVVVLVLFFIVAGHGSKQLSC
jgi:hypothetical protein